MADPLDAKEFLLEHMTDSERERGRTPATRRNDQLAQDILVDAESRPKPRIPEKREHRVDDESPHVDGVDVKTYSREETESLRAQRRERARQLFENQEYFLKYRAMRWLRQFPECKPLFDRIFFWKTTYLMQATDKDAAKIKGTAEAAKIIDQLLAEYQRRTGRPWYFIRKGDEWVSPDTVFKRAAAAYPACH